MKFAYTIEIIPGAPSSRRIEVTEARDETEAWDVARVHARRMGASARVHEVHETPAVLR